MVRGHNCFILESISDISTLFIGDPSFSQLSVPLNVNSSQLLSLVRALIKAEGDNDEDEDEDGVDDRPFLFYVQDQEITSSLEETLRPLFVDKERAVPVVFKPQSLFK